MTNIESDATNLTETNISQDPIFERVESNIRTKTIQNHLILLLHATACPDRSCERARCAQFKSLVNHIKGCGAADACTEPYCTSSRKILGHWRRCQATGCPVCQPLRVVGRQGSRNRAHPYSDARHRRRNNFPFNPNVVLLSASGDAGVASEDARDASEDKKRLLTVASATIKRLVVARGAILSLAADDAASPEEGADSRNDDADENAEDLRKQLEFFRNRTECPVCWEGLKSVALQCGHQCCGRCAANLDKCHTCRSQILLKIKLF